MRIIIVLIVLSSFIIANGNNRELPIGLTDLEKLRINEIYTMGRDTDPPPVPIRNIAEYERMQGVIIRYPFGISLDIIAEMSEDVFIYCLVSANQQNSAFQAMENGSVIMQNVEFVLGPTDSYWTRDYGPWWVVDGNNNISIVDFTYNRPRPNDNDAPIKISDHLDVPYFATDIIHAGGNYMTDGMGIGASSDLVYVENTISNQEVHLKMQQYYGIDTYHVVEDPNNTYIDHIDCWGKYLSPTKVLIRAVPTNHAQYNEIEQTASYFSSSLNTWGEPWQLYRVWTPGNEPYTNSIILNEKVLVPTTGGSWDDEAISTYQEALPGYEILGYSGTWESTDALHCRVKGIPDLQMLQIFHNPLNDGTNPNDSGYAIEALIDDISQSGLIDDSLKVYWKIPDSVTWNFEELYLEDDTETWRGVIPTISDSNMIQYFIRAADSSGRIESSPLAGWHTFYAHPINICADWSIGDLDYSGEIDLFDILLLVDYYNNNVNGICPGTVSDINSDNQISILDIIFLVNIVINQ